MLKRLLLLLLLLECSSLLWAQPDIPKSVVSSSGSTFTNGNLLLSGTTGEITMVTTFNTGTKRLYQGFQNSWYSVFTLNVEPVDNDELTISLFPNPASTLLNMDMSENLSGDLIIRMINASGQEVVRKTGSIFGPKYTLDVSQLAEGWYQLVVCDKHNKKIYSGPLNIIR